MKYLQRFTKDYERLMSTNKVFSDVILKHEESKNPMKALDDLLEEIDSLDFQRVELNIVNSGKSGKDTLDKVFE